MDKDRERAEFDEALAIAKSVRAFADLLKRRYPARANEIEEDAVAAMGDVWRMIGRDS